MTKGKIRCRTRLVHRGGRIAVLESHLSVGRLQVAQALGTFAIFAPRPEKRTVTAAQNAAVCHNDSQRFRNSGHRKPI